MPRIVLLLLLLAVLAGCGSATADQPQQVAELPSVTPVTPTAVPSATAAPAPTEPPPPTSAPAPSATPLQLTSDAEGPVTPTMAQLKVGGERYATLGDPSAPLTIVEFADYGCHFCKEFENNVFPQLKEQYIDTGKVYYVYKDFPVVSQRGDLAAQAAECAGVQGSYWEMHAALFSDQSGWDRTPNEAQDAFRRYAREIGIDADEHAACVAEGRFANDVQQDFNEGVALRMTGTPTFVIHDKLLGGAQPFDVFQQVIEAELINQ